MPDAKPEIRLIVHGRLSFKLYFNYLHPLLLLTIENT